jgi:hypothetical protein
MKTHKITGAMSRKEIAIRYKISGKALNTRLRRHGLHFGDDRVLLPAQIEKIVSALGFWELEVEP